MAWSLSRDWLDACGDGKDPTPTSRRRGAAPTPLFSGSPAKKALPGHRMLSFPSPVGWRPAQGEPHHTGPGQSKWLMSVLCRHAARLVVWLARGFGCNTQPFLLSKKLSKTVRLLDLLELRALSDLFPWDGLCRVCTLATQDLWPFMDNNLLHHQCQFLKGSH
eukprot:scaffold110905_cov28-Prasinocladus_malaysianus.AAC.1